VPADAEQTPANGAEPDDLSGAQSGFRLAASTAAERLAARGFRVAVEAEGR